jgi:hypothetical protein
MEDSDKIPVTFEGRTVGFSYGESGPITITDEDFKKKFEEMSNNAIGISSRAQGTVLEDGTVQRNKPSSLDIINYDIPM